MRVLSCEALVIGAGPAGLSAASELAACGADVLLVDEQHAPGGQLVKQIHKLFGTARHGAGERGFALAERLVRQAVAHGVRLRAGLRAVGVFEEGVVLAAERDELFLTSPSCGVVAVGASERGSAFPGWTLPGVMTAGAAQTLVNLHRVAIGRRVLVVGAGNVGLIVAFQLHQAGISVAAIVESQPRIGGWSVHASKVRRLGIPILTNTCVVAAHGDEAVSRVTLRTRNSGSPSSDSEQSFDVDSVCLAVGLTPRTQLPQQMGCRLGFASALGGYLPLHDRGMRMTVPGWFVAGDAAGVEEAAVAMEEGRLAGLGAARRLAKITDIDFQKEADMVRSTLEALRSGPFGRGRSMAKDAICSDRA